MDNVTIFETHDLVEEFETQLGYRIDPLDHLEIFHQLFHILDQHTPLDLTDRNILTYEQLLFANHLRFDREVVDKLAYHFMVSLWQRLQQRHFYVNGVLMHFPFSMHGYDLCVRRYNS